MEYTAVKIEKGPGGWGGPLILKPKPGKDKILSVTGGGISPVAKKIAELTGATIVDAFKTVVPDDEILAAVIDCGGTARCGVYPKKKILTVNLTPVGQSGPLAKFITEELYVSGVTEKNIIVLDKLEVEDEETHVNILEEKTRSKSVSREKENIVGKIGKGIGNIVSIFYSAGRDSIDSVIKNILPFMAFVSMIIGIILKTGIGDAIAKIIAPYSGSIGGLIVISIIAAIPILSPLLGPGAVIAQVVGVLIGVEIALPALFAINPQVGCDFIPVGLSLGEAEPETVEVGVPAILFSRLITGPIAVIIAYFFSFGLYK